MAMGFLRKGLHRRGPSSPRASKVVGGDVSEAPRNWGTEWWDPVGLVSSTTISSSLSTPSWSALEGDLALKGIGVTRKGMKPDLVDPGDPITWPHCSKVGWDDEGDDR